MFAGLDCPLSVDEGKRRAKSRHSVPRASVRRSQRKAECAFPGRRCGEANERPNADCSRGSRGGNRSDLVPFARRQVLSASRISGCCRAAWPVRRDGTSAGLLHEAPRMGVKMYGRKGSAYGTGRERQDTTRRPAGRIIQCRTQPQLLVRGNRRCSSDQPALFRDPPPAHPTPQVYSP